LKSLEIEGKRMLMVVKNNEPLEFWSY
jgi:hypothetical protein